MTPTVIIIILLFSLFMVGAFIISKSAIFGFVAATAFFMLSFTFIVSGVDEVTGRTVTEFTNASNHTLVTEDLVTNPVTGFHTQLFGILLAGMGIFLMLASVVNMKNGRSDLNG